MTSSIVSLLVVLLAPASAPAEPASTAAAEGEPAPTADATADAVAPDGEPDSADDDEASSLGADPFGGETAASTEAEPAASTEAAPLAAAPAPPAAMALPPPPPRPIRWRLDLGLGFGATMVQDLGYRAFSSRRNLYDFGPSAIFDFRLGQSRFFLGGGLAYQYAQSYGDAYGLRLGSGVRLHEPRVIGRASVMLVEGLDTFARVGVGPSVVDLHLMSSIGDDDYGYDYNTARQRNVLPRVDGQAGLSLYVPKKWLPRKQASRFTAGVELSLGYTWRGTIDVQPALEQDDEPLRATTSPLGELSLHGLSWGFGMFLRVM